MANDKYVPPQFKQKAFTCPFCNVYAYFQWNDLNYVEDDPDPKYNKMYYSGAFIAKCGHCRKATFWLEDKALMLWPQYVSAAPLPNPDMPEDIKIDYLEARSISITSPRGAAALLRLCIQKLCKHLGESGKNINKDIGELVKKGLPIAIQKALDIVRVTGNNAVHPGKMQLQEDSETVTLLFKLLNLIVQDRISQPKEIEEVYGKLPEKAVEGVRKRDGNVINYPERNRD